MSLNDIASQLTTSIEPGRIAGRAAHNFVQQGGTLENSAELGGDSTAAPAAPSALMRAAATVLEPIGRAFNWMTALEQQISSPFAAIPYPALPAMRCLDLEMGFPHGHMHPLNLIPPAVVPLMWPAPSVVLPIPILSGAARCFIAGQAAARTGDMGVSTWCGGYFPMTEIFLGSMTTWIEGSRAARMGLDIHKHCTFSTPRPQDPPLGVPMGLPVTGDFKTLIGGAPMISLTALAFGAAFRAAFKGLGLALRMGKAVLGKGIQQYRKLQRVLIWRREFLKVFSNLTIFGGPLFRHRVLRDLERMWDTPSGQRLIEELISMRKELIIAPPSMYAEQFKRWGAHAQALSPQSNSRFRARGELESADPQGQFAAVLRDKDGRPVIAPDGRALVDVTRPTLDKTGPGDGSATLVVYDPTQATPGTPSDVILAHELDHAANNAAGTSMAQVTPSDPTQRYGAPNVEEQRAVDFENEYRADAAVDRPEIEQRESYNAGLP